MYAVILMQIQDAHRNFVMNDFNYVDATLYV